eukprot:SAG11_NODE_129_length_15500_cov_16.145250_21_plen_87_part_00
MATVAYVSRAFINAERNYSVQQFTSFLPDLRNRGLPEFKDLPGTLKIDSGRLVPASFFRGGIFIKEAVPANLAVPSFKSFSIQKHW